MKINRNDMLELTRRMTDSRTHLARLAGAYMDEEGYVDGTFNTNFLKLQGAEKKHALEIAKTIPFSRTNEELVSFRIPGMKPALTDRSADLEHVNVFCRDGNESLLAAMKKILVLN